MSKENRWKIAIVGGGAAGFFNLRVLARFFVQSINRADNINDYSFPEITIFESNPDVFMGATGNMAKRRGILHFRGDLNRKMIKDAISVMDDVLAKDSQVFADSATQFESMSLRNDTAFTKGSVYAIANKDNCIYDCDAIIQAIEHSIENGDLDGVRKITPDEAQARFGSDEGGLMRKQAKVYFQTDESVFDIDHIKNQFLGWVKRWSFMLKHNLNPEFVRALNKQNLLDEDMLREIGRCKHDITRIKSLPKGIKDQFAKTAFNTSEGGSINLKTGAWVKSVKRMPVTFEDRYDINHAGLDKGKELFPYLGISTISQSVNVSGNSSEIEFYEYDMQGTSKAKREIFDLAIVNAYAGNYKIRKESGDSVNYIKAQAEEAGISSKWVPENSVLMRDKSAVKTVIHGSESEPNVMLLYGPHMSRLTQTDNTTYTTVEHRTNKVLGKNSFELVSQIHDFHEGAKEKFINNLDDKVGHFWRQIIDEIIIGKRGADLPPLLISQTGVKSNNLLKRDLEYYQSHHAQRIKIFDTMTIEMRMLALRMELEYALNDIYTIKHDSNNLSQTVNNYSSSLVEAQKRAHSFDCGIEELTQEVWSEIFEEFTASFKREFLAKKKNLDAWQSDSEINADQKLDHLIPQDRNLFCEKVIECRNIQEHFGIASEDSSETVALKIRRYIYNKYRQEAHNFASSLLDNSLQLHAMGVWDALVLPKNTRSDYEYEIADLWHTVAQPKMQSSIEYIAYKAQIEEACLIFDSWEDKQKLRRLKQICNTDMLILSEMFFSYNALWNSSGILMGIGLFGDQYKSYTPESADDLSRGRQSSLYQQAMLDLANIARAKTCKMADLARTNLLRKRQIQSTPMGFVPRKTSHNELVKAKEDGIVILANRDSSVQDCYPGIPDVQGPIYVDTEKFVFCAFNSLRLAHIIPIVRYFQRDGLKNSVYLRKLSKSLNDFVGNINEDDVYNSLDPKLQFFIKSFTDFVKCMKNSKAILKEVLENFSSFVDASKEYKGLIEELMKKMLPEKLKAVKESHNQPRQGGNDDSPDRSHGVQKEDGQCSLEYSNLAEGVLTNVDESLTPKGKKTAEAELDKLASHFIDNGITTAQATSALSAAFSSTTNSDSKMDTDENHKRSKLFHPQCFLTKHVLMLDVTKYHLDQLLSAKIKNIDSAEIKNIDEVKGLLNSIVRDDSMVPVFSSHEEMAMQDPEHRKYMREELDILLAKYHEEYADEATPLDRKAAYDRFLQSMLYLINIQKQSENTYRFYDFQNERHKASHDPVLIKALGALHNHYKVSFDQLPCSQEVFLAAQLTYVDCNGWKSMCELYQTHFATRDHDAIQRFCDALFAEYPENFDISGRQENLYSFLVCEKVKEDYSNIVGGYITPPGTPPLLRVSEQKISDQSVKASELSNKRPSAVTVLRAPHTCKYQRLTSEETKKCADYSNSENIKNAVMTVDSPRMVK